MWAIPQQAKLKYTQLFNLHDRSRSGFLSGLQCRDILLQSGLPRNILAEIWNLSDIDGDGQLTREEFILAMHLTNHVRSGQSLPSELPTDLVPPSYRRPRSISATSVNSASSSIIGSNNDDLISEKSADLTALNNTAGSVLNSQTFEDRRRENFEKGRAELERRRLKVIEQQTSNLNEELAVRKKEVAEAKAKIDKMRSDRDTKAGLITSLEAQLQTVRDRKAYLDHEELSLIAIAKDLNLVNSADAIELDAQATRVKQENIKQMKEKLAEIQRESANKAALLAEATKKLDESKNELKQVSEEATNVYEKYKEKVAKAKIMRQQFIEENKSKTIDLDSIWDSAPTFSPSSINKAQESNSKQQPELSAFEPDAVDPWSPMAASNVISNNNNSSDNKNIKPASETFSSFEANPTSNDNFGPSRDYSALADLTSTTNDSMNTRQAVNAFDDDIRASNARKSDPLSTKRKYRALYAFEARNPDELTINPGDIIIGSEVVCEPGWLSGETSGKHGLFPEAYVEPLPADDIDDIVASTAKINLKQSTATTPTTNATTTLDSSPARAKYKVLYEFQARNVDELTMNPGDIIFGVEGPHEPGWLMGELNGQKGLFPEAYVEKMIEIGQTTIEQTTATTGTLRRGSSSGSLRSKKSRAKKAEVATVIANYRALGQEQLSLEKGQLVAIRRKMDSGWWEGELQIKGPNELDYLTDELISSELDYVNDLRLCYNAYMLPLSTAMNLTSLDTQMFDTWHQLIQLHSVPIEKLTSSKYLINHKRVFATFQQLLTSIVDTYIRFCSHQSASIRQLESKMVSDIRFRQLINESQRNLNRLIEQQIDSTNLNDSSQMSRAIRNSNLPLTSFLIKPMQRITKYSLLFERMSKVASKIEEMPKDLVKQIENLKGSAQLLCQQVNEACRLREDEEINTKRLRWCQNHIKQVNYTNNLPPLPMPLIGVDAKQIDINSFSTMPQAKPGFLHEDIIFDSETRHLGPRRLVKAGSLIKIKTSGREIVAFLFNDLLLLTQVKNIATLRVENLFKSDQAQQAYYKLYKPPILLEYLIVRDYVRTIEREEPISNSLLCSPISTSSSSVSIGSLDESMIISFLNQEDGQIYNFMALNETEKTNWTCELTRWSEAARSARSRYLSTQTGPSLDRGLSINDCFGRLFVTVLEFNRTAAYAGHNRMSSGSIESDSHQIDGPNRNRWQRMSFISQSIQNVCINIQLFRYRRSLGSSVAETVPLSDVFKTKTFQWMGNNNNNFGGHGETSQTSIVKFDDDSTQFLIANKLIELDEDDYLHIELVEDSRYKRIRVIARQRISIDQLLRRNDYTTDSMSNCSMDREQTGRRSLRRLQPDRPTELVIKLKISDDSLIMAHKLRRDSAPVMITPSQSSSHAAYKCYVKLRLHLQSFCDNQTQ